MYGEFNYGNSKTSNGINKIERAVKKVVAYLQKSSLFVVPQVSLFSKVLHSFF